MHVRDFDLNELPANQTHRLLLDITPRAESGMWQLPAIVMRGAQDGPRLTLFGAVHGDEYDGPEVAYWLADTLQPAQIAGTVLICPICNPPAYAAASRLSPIDNHNLARVFPGQVDGTLSQQYAYWLTEKFIRGSALLLDIHSGGLLYQLPTLIGYTQSEQPQHREGERAARAFAANNDLVAIWAHPAPLAPGRSLSAADALGIPALYTEAEGAGRVSASTRATFCRGVLQVLAHLDMIGAETLAALQLGLSTVTNAPRPIELIGDGNLDQQISAPCAGQFSPACQLLDEVVAGQRIGRICNAIGVTLAEITAPCAGVVITLRGLHRVQAGDGIAHLTQRHR